jgi:hypothetical protein
MAVISIRYRSNTGVEVVERWWRSSTDLDGEHHIMEELVEVAVRLTLGLGQLGWTLSLGRCAADAAVHRYGQW